MAIPSDMPDAVSATVPSQSTSQSSSTQPQQNGTASQTPAGTEKAQQAGKGDKKQKQKQEKETTEGGATGGEAAADGEEKKLSGAELKKRAKEEKAARRAAEKAVKEGPAGPAPVVNGKDQQNQKDASKSNQQQQQKSGASTSQHHRRTPSQSAGAQLPVRGKPAAAPATGPTIKEIKKANKEVGLFGHLYGQPKRQTLEGVSKEVHPAVIALGFQMSSYEICGSNARVVAMLLAFKKAIQAYQTPQGTSLARHLTSHHLSPQIDYLKSHRPISVSMGNAIRWLKDFIIHIDPDTPESEAKADICAAIDIFIRERITVADTAIANNASTKIRDGSTIVTFGKSSIVEKTLLRAHEKGTNFSVVVIDSRPLFEGKHLAKSLAAVGIPTRYMFHTATSHALKDADLVLLGAHAMMSNGRLYSRVGTAAVAMLAYAKDIPVIVTCESLKFTDRVALDSIVLNEIASPDELVIPPNPLNSDPTEAKPEAKGKGGSGGGGKKDEDKEEVKKPQSGLQGWRDVQNLQLLNIMYDVTPAEYITMIISEYGSLPPSSVPVVHRIAMEKDIHG